MRRFTFLCEGKTPLIMHNGRLVDPLDTVVKQIREVSSKTKKTDSDHEELAKLEWLGGIYYSTEVGPFIPADNLQKCLIEGARLNRGGKTIERGLYIETLVIPLVYDGPKKLEELYDERRFVHRVPVKVSKARVMRTRPIFKQWGLQATGWYDESVLNLDALQEAARNAGTMIGLGDRRPTYGRFHSTVEGEE